MLYRRRRLIHLDSPVLINDKMTNYYLWLNERGINMPVFTTIPADLIDEQEISPDANAHCLDCQAFNSLNPGLKNSFGGTSPKILFIGDGHSPIPVNEEGPLPSGERLLIVNIAKALGLTSETFHYAHHHTCERHFLEKLRVMNPCGVVLLGSESLNMVSGKVLNFATLRGKVMYPDLYKIPTMVTHHLRDMIKTPENKAIVWNDLKLLKDHLDQHQERK